jgi:hypothetical protein
MHACLQISTTWARYKQHSAKYRSKIYKYYKIYQWRSSEKTGWESFYNNHISWLCIYTEQPFLATSLFLYGFEGASNSFKLLDRLKDTRTARSCRICLARSSLSIIPRCYWKILSISGAQGLNLLIKAQSLAPILRLLACFLMSHVPNFIKHSENMLTIMSTICQIFTIFFTLLSKIIIIRTYPTQSQRNSSGNPNYRIYSFERRGALWIFRASDAALNRGRRSLKKLLFVNYKKNF